jgi:hypothetical protein
VLTALGFERVTDVAHRRAGGQEGTMSDLITTETLLARIAEVIRALGKRLIADVIKFFTREPGMDAADRILNGRTA